MGSWRGARGHAVNERVLLDVARYHRAGACARAWAEGNGCDQKRIATEEDIIAERCGIFGDTVKVTGDRAGANINIFADGRIADVTEMTHFDAPTKKTVLDLAKVAHVHIFAQVSAGAQMTKWADFAAALHPGFLDDTVLDAAGVANCAVDDAAARPDMTAGADGGLTLKMRARIDHRVLADGHGGVNV